MFERLRYVTLWAALGGVDPVLAAADGPQSAGGDHVVAEDDMLDMRRKMVADTLQLDRSVAAKFWPLYDHYQSELASLRAARRDLLIYLGQNYDNMTDDEARRYIADKLGQEEARIRLDRHAFTEMGKVLTAHQLARLFQFESKVKAFIEAGIEEEVPLMQ